MKLKYYLRGLGIGIVVTTLILTIAFSGHKEKLSDDEIIKRAEELGMVMADTEDTSSDEIPDDTENGTEIVSEDTENPLDTEQDTEADTEPDSETETKADTKQDTKADSEQGTGQAEENTPVQETAAQSGTGEVSFTISSGESSDTVAFNLYKAGLVENASDFNRYMVNNNYDSRLRAGTYSLKSGMSYDEIMKVLVP